MLFSLVCWCGQFLIYSMNNLQSLCGRNQGDKPYEVHQSILLGLHVTHSRVELASSNSSKQNELPPPFVASLPFNMPPHMEASMRTLQVTHTLYLDSSFRNQHREDPVLPDCGVRWSRPDPHTESGFLPLYQHVTSFSHVVCGIFLQESTS